MSKNNILLINDRPGYSRVALSAMTPILYHMGFGILNLPTALVSNTLDYGEFSILDTTKYMRECIEVWKKLKFNINSISTGFVLNEEQIEIIEEIIEDNKIYNPYVMVDPIMADNGKLYNGIEKDRIEIMRDLISYADLTIPNITEAYLLLENRFNRVFVDTKMELKDLIDGIREKGSKSVVITSVKASNEKYYIAGYDNKNKEYFKVPYEKIDVNYPGTGDIFSSVVLGYVLKNVKLKYAVKIAADFIYNSIKESERNRLDRNEGINLELYIHNIKKDL
ncbi:pyridoxamine kinase [Miniphocaeibacter massiliensis]|uniref:pyridoxamine kinase n=1 Tax=Miniphocaeibacter massiliensis TaxID=2041841 RepID=UPI000C07B92F|nr:pyridoxamine kinase [Miniphocaeibacter massiliensis]